MSFFKKLTEEFKELKANFDDSGKEKKDEKKDSEVKPEKTAEGTRDGGSGPPPYAGGDAYGQHQQQYGAPPSQYQQAPPSQYPQAPPSQYNQPPNGQQYAATPPPPPSGAAPPGQPQLPPGWISQWDHTQQRYYYVEQATGRTQWDAPQNYNYSSPPPQHGGYAPPPTGPGGYPEQSRDQGAATGFYNQYGGAMPAQGYNNPQHQDNAQQYYGDVAKTEKKEEKKAEKKKEDHSTRNMLLAGAGGLAVGGLAVAALDSDSDDEHKSHAPAPAAPAPSFDPGYGSSNAGYGAPAAAGYGAGGYGADPSYGGYPPAAPPPGDESDRESLIEARQDYNEAVEAAADSDASSSELEELQEAREDYEEAAEDCYED